jgi:hypothetical protein
MSARFPIRVHSKLIALVAALVLVAFAAEANEPVVIESSAWTTTGTMKVKVNSVQQELGATVTLEFGPSVDLLEGEFRLTVDDGLEPFELVGPYEELEPGKPTFSDLGDVAAEALGLVPVPGLPDFEVSSKIKAKPKLEVGVETIKIAFKIKVKLSIEGESMSLTVGYKGEGARAE